VVKELIEQATTVVPARVVPGSTPAGLGRRCAPCSKSGAYDAERSALPAFAAAPATRTWSRASAN
jgi:hypothetical protein